jgi:DNA polymerase III epsilon subunit-like protein
MRTVNSTATDQPDLCFIDVETTGHRFDYHEIIEGGAIRTSWDGRTELARWHARIRPQYPERATIDALAVNGYNEQTWQPTHASTPDVWQGLSELLNGCVPVAHNPSFDRAFLERAWSLGGIAFERGRQWIGTESLAWPLVVAGHIPSPSLTDICKFLGVPIEPIPHRALSGAETARAVYLAIMKQYSVLFSTHRTLPAHHADAPSLESPEQD